MGTRRKELTFHLGIVKVVMGVRTYHFMARFMVLALAVLCGFMVLRIGGHMGWAWAITAARALELAGEALAEAIWENA